ncbi:MAG TPA: hypothetical protein VMF67_18215 [Rhizomicrobium sp.]|nr:hypothetical protein [Rhizomicrobium sp.]
MRCYEPVYSIAVYPHLVKPGFWKGAELSKSDPNKLPKGSGKTARYVELHSVADFDRPEIEALIANAVTLAKLRLDPDAKGTMTIKAEEQKKRRATKVARPARRAKASAK